MAASASDVTALRSLLATRFPERIRKSVGVIATGIPGIDDALGGGLPTGRMTELVSANPGTGGQTVLTELLRITRTGRQRIALIDGANAFVPEDVPPDHLRHLVWVRPHDVNQAFATADILVRDGNYAAVVLDLRGTSERALLKTPATIWHRLRHATEASPSAVLVQTTTPLVPTVPYRLILRDAVSLAKRRIRRSELLQTLTVHVDRARTDAWAQSA